MLCNRPVFHTKTIREFDYISQTHWGGGGVKEFHNKIPYGDPDGDGMAEGMEGGYIWCGSGWRLTDDRVNGRDDGEEGRRGWTG